MRRLLLYLKQVLEADVRGLHALLTVGLPGKPLEWVKLITSDLKLLSITCDALQGMPPPAADPEPWLKAIDDDKWSDWCKTIFFLASAPDQKRPAGEQADAADTWHCRICVGE